MKYKKLYEEEKNRANRLQTDLIKANTNIFSLQSEIKEIETLKDENRWLKTTLRMLTVKAKVLEVYSDKKMDLLDSAMAGNPSIKSIDPLE